MVMLFVGAVSHQPLTVGTTKRSMRTRRASLSTTIA